MKLTEEQYKEASNDNYGYCRLCDDLAEFGGVEPDAQGYMCPDCDVSEMMGADQALLLGFLEIVSARNFVAKVKS